MTIFKKLVSRFFAARPAIVERCESDKSAGHDVGEQGLDADLGYSKLEPRQVLSASFSLAGGLLTLDQFDAGEDLTFSQDNVDIGGLTVDAYIFEIANGTWSGTVGAGIELETPDRLEVDASLLTVGTFVDGSNTISLTQQSSFSIESFSLTNFTIADRAIKLDIDGNVALENIVVSDTDPGDGFDPDINVQATGSIAVTGDLQNLSTNPVVGIELRTTGITSDIVFGNAEVVTAAGSINLVAADEITLDSGTSVTAGLAGDITLEANADEFVGDKDAVSMDDGATVVADLGNIEITADGNGGGSVLLGSIATSGDVAIKGEGDIVDGTANEDANIAANRVDLTAASIGTADDIDIDVVNVSFNSIGDVKLRDLAGGITVDQASSAGSGALTANSPLTISANINLAGSFSFTAGDSNVAGDHLTINNNAVVNLVAGAAETLDFTAGDDIVFDTGRITTSGGTHTVNLTADNEAALDADRGSITNTGGSTDESVITNQLNVLAAEGVGVAGTGLRVNVDNIAIANSLTNGIFVCDTDDIIIDNVTNVDSDIAIAAGGFIQIVGNLDAGAGNVRLLGAGDIFQSAIGSTIIADELGVRQIATATGASNDFDANLRLDIVLDGAGNDVNTFAAANAFDGGVIALVDADEVIIGTVSGQSICAGSGQNFTNVIGVATTFTGAAVAGGGDIDEGDILIQTGGSIQIDSRIIAGVTSGGPGDVRFVAGGDIHQDATGTIRANELGIEQNGITIFNASDDLDFNERIDILLDDANNIDVLAASNDF